MLQPYVKLFEYHLFSNCFCSNRDKMNDINSNSLYNLANKVLLLFGFLSVGVTSITPCLAQSNIAPDNTLGTEASQVTPNVNNSNGIPSELIEGGAQRGQNLFHSFRQFNVSEGRGAYFLVPSNNIQNILTRVTGNNSSQILGVLGTTSNRNFAPSNANLFLINPNGIVFGKNARLDINGSFVGTTANAVEFGKERFFSVTNPQTASELLTINPSAFLFNQINAQASIQNNSVAEVGLNKIDDFTPKGLRVADGKSLLLLGGNVNIDGGGLVALGGRIELGGNSALGSIGLNQDGNNLSLSFPNSLERSDVSLNNNAVVTVTSDNGGSLAVNARNLEIAGESFLVAGVDIRPGSDNTKPGNVDLKVTGVINLSNSSYIRNQVLPGASRQTGDININAGTLKVQGGAQVSAGTFGTGKGGASTIDAQDVQLIGKSKDGRFPSGLFVSANSTGDAGDLTIRTNTLLVKDGAQVNAGTFGAGSGGNLTVDAQHLQLIDKTKNAQFPSGLFASAQSNSRGDAGNLTIRTNTLLVKNGALVSVSTFGEGKGGDLTIKADSLQLQNGGTITARSAKTGEAGDINISIKDDFNADNGQVLTQAEKSSGGNINITVGKNIFLRNNSDIRTILSTTTGSGGNITLSANNIVALEDSDILAFAPEGTGGDITFNTNAFFSDSLFSPTLQTTGRARLDTLDGNNRVDVNASGKLRSGRISGITDTSFLQDSLTELPESPIDSEALIASSCVVRSQELNGTFFIATQQGFPYRPGDTAPSKYSVIDVQSIPKAISAKKMNRKWKIGDPIVEPTGVYRLVNGKRIISRECGK